MRSHTKRRDRRPRGAESGNGPVLGERYTWTDADVTWSFPQESQAEKGIEQSDPELHNVLWALEHVTNREGFDENLPLAVTYLADHPGNTLVEEAIRRAEERVKRVTS